MIAVGERFGRYELLELIGHNDRGAIYKAREVPLERIVALRLVPPEIADDGVVRARLNREATALAAIDHPNVPPIYEAAELEHRLYIASRWVDGVDLGSLAREDGPLDPHRAVRIANQVASALAAAHALGIMHRNVNPSNVLITSGDHAYLTDFALARRSEDLTGLTAQEQLAHSYDYLAPEYLAGGDADQRVDIYGLGCVLYEALTGEVPFDGPGPAAKMYAHASAEPPSPRAKRPEIPERLDAMVRKALAKDPDERQQSAADFALEAAMAIDMSPPLWATGGRTADGSRPSAVDAPPAPAPASALQEVERPEEPSPAPAKAAPEAAAPVPAPEPLDRAPVPGDHARDGYNDPVYYLRGDHQRRGQRRWAPWVVALVVVVVLLLLLLL